MTWVAHHSQSEQFAALAEHQARMGQREDAIASYKLAAQAEAEALSNLDPAKIRTLGITVVSTAALWFKAQEFHLAKRVAYQWLASETLPGFAVEQLEAMLQEILTLERTATVQV